MPESLIRTGIENKLLEQINVTASQTTRGKEPCLQSYDKNIRIADLGLDSLKLVELVFELEAEFGIDVDESMLIQVSTLGDLVELIFTAIHAEVAT
ncbi:MAG: acyl carrier protein [Pseudomonadota bacterium]|nr:acyl carrier protein [Pseudomonadota bacterium]